MAGTTNLSLLERVRRSPKEENWREFLKVYSPYVERYLGTIQVQEADVSDIRQEVMQIVIRELPRFEHNQRKGAFRTWLRQVVANRLRDYNRSRFKQPQGAGGSVYAQLAQQLEDANSDLTRLWDEEHNRHVVRCLLDTVRSQFQEKTLQAFRRVVLQEIPAQQVADELKMTVNAVRIAQARVLKALREFGEGLID